MASLFEKLKLWAFGAPTVKSPSPLPGFGEGQYLQGSPEPYEAPVISQGFLAACVGACIWGMIQTMSRGLAPKTPSYDKLFWEGTREIIHKVGWNQGTFIRRMLDYIDFEAGIAENARLLQIPHSAARWELAAQVIRRLYEGRPVGLSMTWTTGMAQPTNVRCKDGTTLPVMEWVGDVIGGHCAYALQRVWVEVENPDRAARKKTPWVRAPFIRIKNSNGTDWGLNGCGYMRDQEFGRMFQQRGANAFTFDIDPDWWSEEGK